MFFGDPYHCLKFGGEHPFPYENQQTGSGEPAKKAPLGKQNTQFAVHA